MKTSLGNGRKWRLDYRSFLLLHAQAEPLLRELIQQQCSIVADQSLEEFKAFNADRRLARLLGVPLGTALLDRNRTALDPERRAMEFDVGHDRCERFALTLNLRPE